MSSDYPVHFTCETEERHVTSRRGSSSGEVIVGEFRPYGLGPYISHGTVQNWFKKVGDRIVSDEPLVTIATDSLSTHLSFPFGGVIIAIHAVPGNYVDEKTPLAAISVQLEEAWKDISSSIKPDPAILRFAIGNGVDLRSVKGSAFQGRVSMQDVSDKVQQSGLPIRYYAKSNVQVDNIGQIGLGGNVLQIGEFNGDIVVLAPPPDRFPSPPQYQTQVFLCHSSEDKERVRELYRRLTNDGVRCWFDDEDLLPGHNWDLEIRKAMKASRFVLALLSETSTTKSGYVHKEINNALDLAAQQPDGSVYLIPARLEECKIPDRLAPIQSADLFKPGGYDRLLRTLSIYK